MSLFTFYFSSFFVRLLFNFSFDFNSMKKSLRFSIAKCTEILNFKRKKLFLDLYFYSYFFFVYSGVLKGLERETCLVTHLRFHFGGKSIVSVMCNFQIFVYRIELYNTVDEIEQNAREQRILCLQCFTCTFRLEQDVPFFRHSFFFVYEKTNDENRSTHWNTTHFFYIFYFQPLDIERSRREDFFLHLSRHTTIGLFIECSCFFLTCFFVVPIFTFSVFFAKGECNNPVARTLVWRRMFI